jgi:hypothetical protein
MRTIIIIAAIIAATFAPADACNGGQCTATTAAGTRCSRKAAEGSDKCWQHARQAAPAPAQQAAPSQQCTGQTKAGARCRNMVKGGTKCHLHR